MDNARDEPLIVQLWLYLEKCFGWDCVRVVFASSTVTVSLNVTLYGLVECPKNILKILVSHSISSFFSFLFFISQKQKLLLGNRE